VEFLVPVVGLKILFGEHVWATMIVRLITDLILQHRVVSFKVTLLSVMIKAQTQVKASRFPKN
jgi:hypothetical protein